MFFAIASYMHVANPEHAADFLQQRLGFQCQYKDGRGWCAENGAMSLVLQQGDSAHSILEVESSNPEEDAQKLMAFDDIHADGALERHGRRIQQALIADCGIRLLLSHILTEDDLNELPELPCQLPWDEQAKLHTQRILRIVPLCFRDKARERVTERAEYLAVAAGGLTVDEPQAMQALVDSALSFQYESVYEAMQDEGIDPSPYQVPNSDAAI